VDVVAADIINRLQIEGTYELCSMLYDTLAFHLRLVYNTCVCVIFMYFVIILFIKSIAVTDAIIWHI